MSLAIKITMVRKLLIFNIIILQRGAVPSKLTALFHFIIRVVTYAHFLFEGVDFLSTLAIIDIRRRFFGRLKILLIFFVARDRWA